MTLGGWYRRGCLRVPSCLPFISMQKARVEDVNTPWQVEMEVEEEEDKARPSGKDVSGPIMLVS